MGATLTVNETSSEMIRLVGNELVQETSQRNLYTVPPKGEYEFMITGYALPFEMAKSEQYGGGMQTMTRLEFTIAEGKGAGKMWTELFGFSIGEKANLGRLLRKLKVDLSPDASGNWDLDRAVGYVGKGYGVPSDKLDEDTGKPKYFRLSLDTVEPVSAPERPYSITIETREPVGAAAGNGNTAPAADDGWE
jgi:hypothetical protein